FDSVLAGAQPETEWKRMLAAWHGTRQMPRLRAIVSSAGSTSAEDIAFVEGMQRLLRLSSRHGSRWLTTSWAVAAVEEQDSYLTYMLQQAPQVERVLPMLWDAAVDAEGGFGLVLAQTIEANDPELQKRRGDEQVAKAYAEAF